MTCTQTSRFQLVKVTGRDIVYCRQQERNIKRILTKTEREKTKLSRQNDKPTQILAKQTKY